MITDNKNAIKKLHGDISNTSQSLQNENHDISPKRIYEYIMYQCLDHFGECQDEAIVSYVAYKLYVDNNWAVRLINRLNEMVKK